MVIGAALLLVAVAAGAVWLLLRPAAVRPSVPVTQVTFDGRLAMNPSISADAKYVAYASDRAGQGNLDIWVQALPGGDPARLTQDEANDDYPAFSPDGTKIAYRSERDGGGIYVVPVLGGAARLLIKNGTRPIYSPDGKYLLYTSFTWQDIPEILIMPAEGGEPRKIEASPRGRFESPIWSPDARRILAVRGWEPFSAVTAWFVLPVAGGPPTRSYEHSGPATPLAWLPDGRILFSALSGDVFNLWLAKLSPGDWRSREKGERLTFGAGQISSASAANNGTIVFSSTMAPTRLWSLPLPKNGQPGVADVLAFPPTGSKDYFPSLSANHKMAYLSQKSGKWNVLIRDLQNGTETWLASIEGTNWYGISTVIKRDGSRVAYSTCRGWFDCSIFVVAASGGIPQKLCDRCGLLRAWSSDGMEMASETWVLEKDNRREACILRVNPHTGEKRLFTEKRGVRLFAPDLSPDGRWVAFQASPGNSPWSSEQLFVAPWDSGEPVDPARWIMITDLGHFDAGPIWSHDGRMLYFISNRDGSTCLWAIRLDPISKKPAGEPFPVRHFHASPRQYSNATYPVFSIGPDRIVISLEQVQSDLWMMQLPDSR